MEAIETIAVGPFAVADVSRARLVEALVADWELAKEPVRVFALHVGGLNRRRDESFVQLLNDAEWLYADGAAVVLVARAAGAKSIQRAPTTDLAHLILEELARRARRTVRVALVGGPPGLAGRAADRLAELHDVEIVLTSDGFKDDWVPVLSALRAQEPDVLIVGMGMPREAAWVSEHLLSFPTSLILTCGGWFGFLAGEESRAPALLQRFGAEWLWRMLQSPRLISRYAQGLATTAHLFASTRTMRSKQSRRRRAI